MRHRKNQQLSTENPTIQLSHKITLVPTPEQITYFGKACGTARFTWNWALAEWNRQFDAGLKPNFYSLKKAFNAIKYKEYPWLNEIHRDAHAEPFSNLGKAWSSFFKDLKEGKPVYAPVFKKKGKCRDSFYVANDKFHMDGKTITLPIVGPVVMTEELRFKGKVLGTTVSRSADRWFVAIQVEMPAHEVLRQRTGDEIEGADLGISTAVTLSTGEKIHSPKPLAGALRRVKIRGRSVSRKLEAAKIVVGIKPGSKIPKGTRLPVSNNRKKASVVLAKTHYRIGNIRTDFTHKLTTRLCCENQALGLEDLNVKGMLANHRLALAISDVGFGAIKRQAKYKALLYGTKIIEADQWFPSSKMCSICDYVNKDLQLSEREWICPNCGIKHDRDVNAAKNLKRLATASALPVASPAVMSSTDVAQKASGGKVTSVSYEYRPQEASGQKERREHFCSQLE
jgi:putative transposase